MELNYFILVIFVYKCRWLLCGQEDRCKLIKVSLEKTLELFKERNSVEKSFFKVRISFLDILEFTLFINVKNSELIARLTISCLCRASQILNSLSEILGNTESKMIEDSHPMNTNLTSLVSTHAVVFCCLLF